MEPIVYWDAEDDPEGNYQHILEHGLTKEEVEEVVQNRNNEQVPSDSTGRPATFGWTTTGRHIIVIWEHVCDDPLSIYPVTAYDVPPQRRRR